MDDVATHLVLMVLIIDHLTVVHQSLDASNEILGVLSQPGHNILEFSEAHMGVDIVCHCLVYSVEEGRAFALVSLYSSLLPVGINCACISRDLISKAAKMYLRWSLLSGMMQLKRNQFSRVCQKMQKEWYASFESQSYMGRLMDAVLDVSMLVMASAVVWAD